jgi:uncharacterized protein (DUF433 family)
LASGASFQGILELYPYLEEDIKAAFSYAIWWTEEFELPLKGDVRDERV